METAYKIAGIDVHKKMLAVVVANARDTELKFECRQFGTTASELQPPPPPPAIRSLCWTSGRNWKRSGLGRSCTPRCWRSVRKVRPRSTRMKHHRGGKIDVRGILESLPAS